MDDRWQSHIDKIIQEAQERGEFDLKRLKGKKLEDDRTEIHAGDRAMANKVLKNSGHAPPFLMKKRDIDAMLDKERTRLLRYALRRRRLLAAAEDATEEDAAEALHRQADQDWRWAIAQFEKEIPRINREIETFNLMNQIPNLFKMKIRLEREIERAEKQVESESG